MGREGEWKGEVMGKGRDEKRWRGRKGKGKSIVPHIFNPTVTTDHI